MNLLIAIISDVYEKVQSNSKAANARSLAGMLLEMEEIVNFKRAIFGQNEESSDPYYYLFFSKRLENSNEDNEEWEGMFGALKNGIKRTQDLMVKMLQILEKKP